MRIGKGVGPEQGRGMTCNVTLLIVIIILVLLLHKRPCNLPLGCLCDVDPRSVNLYSRGTCLMSVHLPDSRPLVPLTEMTTLGRLGALEQCFRRSDQCQEGGNEVQEESQFVGGSAA